MPRGPHSRHARLCQQGSQGSSVCLVRAALLAARVLYFPRCCWSLSSGGSGPRLWCSAAPHRGLSVPGSKGPAVVVVCRQFLRVARKPLSWIPIPGNPQKLVEKLARNVSGALVLLGPKVMEKQLLRSMLGASTLPGPGQGRSGHMSSWRCRYNSPGVSARCCLLEFGLHSHTLLCSPRNYRR